MVLNTNNNCWYYLGYELTFLDLDKHRIITNDAGKIFNPKITQIDELKNLNIPLR